jgi:hypothetical protein
MNWTPIAEKDLAIVRKSVIHHRKIAEKLVPPHPA